MTTNEAVLQAPNDRAGAIPLPLRVVLVGTSHPGNIGAAARAMKTMGLSELVLVRPQQFPHPEADARASGAVDVLEAARVYADLDDALADCALVIGSSARVRNLGPAPLPPRTAAARLVAGAATRPAALLFGCERSGLSNEELDRCHAFVQIPTNAEYSSLNLGMAVQLLCYELRMAWLAQDWQPSVREAEDVPASAADLERFYEHLERVLVAAEFLDPDNPRRLMRRLRLLFGRAAPDEREMNILRGMLTALDPHGEPARRRSRAVADSLEREAER